MNGDAIGVSTGALESKYMGLYTNLNVAFVYELEKPSSKCISYKPVKLTAGTLGMKLNCKDKGEFTFEASGTYWNIKNSEGKYLNAENGKLVLGDTVATAWTYKKGAFSTSVKTTKKNSGHWFGFIYIPGRGTKTVTTTYYLNRVDAGSLSTCYVCAELYTKVSGEHSYKYVNKCNGTHDKICKNCGDKTNESCVYNQTGDKCICGAYDPSQIDVKISVDVKEKKIGWKTSYVANIKTEATGTKVCKVQYQMNDSSKWQLGTVVCSNKPIEKLNVKVLASNGKWYTYEYPEVEETTTVEDILKTVQGGFPAANEDESFDGYWVNGKGVYLFTLEDIELGSFINIWHPDTGDNITLDSGVTADGDNWKCYTYHGGEVTLVMKDAVLTSIEISGETGIRESINSTYTAPGDQVDGNIWFGRNETRCYVNSEVLIFEDEYSHDKDSVSFADTVTSSSGDSYTCASQKGGTITFTMNSGDLVSITIVGSTESEINDTYTE